MKLNIALIAHDGKKSDMVSFILNNQEFLGNASLFATGTTGSKIEKEGFEVTKLLSGPLGGDAQIATMVATGEIDMVIFFRDPLDKHPHEPDVQMLMRQCDVHNVPLATNPKAAHYLLRGVKSVFN
ncbi:MAG: methylglyoxal synthase [Saprospiraceae bacterium]|nr:methylglyoxal synthase [Bacteroidia bacterium]NNL91170.1 methylglyoxal synthase [Saprospiraceae bacterium]